MINIAYSSRIIYKTFSIIFPVWDYLLTFVLISGLVAPRGALDEHAMNRVRRSCIPEVHPIKLFSTWHKTHLSELIATVRSRVIRLRFYAIGRSAIKSRSHDQDPTHGIKSKPYLLHKMRSHPTVHQRSNGHQRETSIHQQTSNRDRPLRWTLHPTVQDQFRFI